MKIECVKSENQYVIDKLKEGNKLYVTSTLHDGNVSPKLRKATTENGQHPYAIVIACSDSRVIPEAIFSAGIGELFVIRVAGNVLDNHQLGSIEYAASHLDANVIIMLGHTQCGAVAATINNHGTPDKFIKYIVEDISEAIGNENNDYKATVLNVKHGVGIINKEFHDHPEIDISHLDVVGAVYNIDTGVVDWV